MRRRGSWTYATGGEAEFTAELAFAIAITLSVWAVQQGRAKLRMPPRWPSHCRRKTSWYCGRSIETVENMSSRLADAIFVATRTTSSREPSTGVCCARARTSLIRLTATGGSLSPKLLLEAPPA